MMPKLLLLSCTPLIGALFLGGIGCQSESREIRLFRAASDGDEREVSSLIAAGTNVNAREAHGETPLMYAAARGQTEMVLFPLEKGADINAVSDNGETALVRAAGDAKTVSEKRRRR